MTLADVYEHNAKECREAAERTYNATHRAMLLKTAREWGKTRKRCAHLRNCGAKRTLISKISSGSYRRRKYFRELFCPTRLDLAGRDSGNSHASDVYSAAIGRRRSACDCSHGK